MRGAAADKGPGRLHPGRGFLLILTGVLVTAGVAVGLRTLGEPGAPPVTPTIQAADLRTEAAALIEEIEAYRQEQGTLPDPSLLAPYLEEGYEYHVINPTDEIYVVQRSAGGVTVTYDGTLPLGLWLVLGGSASGGSP